MYLQINKADNGWVIALSGNGKHRLWVAEDDEQLKNQLFIWAIPALLEAERESNITMADIFRMAGEEPPSE